MSIRLGTNIIAGRAYQPSLLDMKWSDHIIYDPSWLRADDWSWHYSSYATPAYNHLVTEWNAGNTVVETETVAGISISYRRAADGHKIVPSDYASIVEQIYSATGVAWYYILDITNTRFKLPRTKWGFTGLRGTVGNYVAPGLPNITGTATFINSDGIDQSTYPDAGALFFSDYSSNTITSKTSGGPAKRDLKFDASRSNNIYGKSSTVQPAGTQMYLYFYCGNSAQSALETTAGINTALFEGKVDKGHEVIAFQEPTSANNWTWYRKYADGWVEQGGWVQGNTVDYAITLPVIMSDTHYTVSGMPDNNSGVAGGYVMINQNSQTATGFTLVVNFSGTEPVTKTIRWQVSGMAA